MISVVIPCFNAAETLPGTLACLPETVKVICVNDASTDATADILAARQSNTTVVTLESNMGLGAARNAGVKAADTEFVVFLDADDWLAEGFFDALTAYLQPRGTAEAASNDWLYHPYATWGGPEENPQIRRVDRMTCPEDLITKRMPFAPSGAILRRELCLAFPWDENRALQGTEDLDLWMRLMRAGHQATLWDNKAWTLYRSNQGMTRDLAVHAKKVLARHAIMLTKGWISEKVAATAAGETWRQVGRSHHKAGQFDQAITAYNRAPSTGKTLLLKWLANMHYGL